MDKQAKVEQIKRELPGWNMLPPQLVSDILEAAGHFELVKITKAARACMEPIVFTAAVINDPNFEIGISVKEAWNMRDVLASMDALERSNNG